METSEYAEWAWKEQRRLALHCETVGKSQDACST